MLLLDEVELIGRYSLLQRGRSYAELARWMAGDPGRSPRRWPRPGMRVISRDLLHMTPPDSAELDRAYATLKQLHGAAYDWSPPDVAGIERLGATRMRQYVRAWINEWDLLRLDPTYTPSTEVVDVVSSYEEDSEGAAD